MVKITVRKIGNSLGVILPAEATATLRVTEGDQLFLTETPDGFRITPYDPEFERKMKIAEEGMRRYKNALRELAK
jgi:putative addiction module antidote